MNNSLFNYMNTPPINNGATNFLTQFNQFRSMFSGDPQTQVQQLLNSGRMTPQQFEQFAQLANQLRLLLK